jgi:3-oxoadipate enol-lactonase
MIRACTRGFLGVVLILLALVPRAVTGQSKGSVGTTSAGIAYESTGSGEAVVLIHAFSVDRRMWAPQSAFLEGRFQVVRYDLRGHGESAAPSAPYTTYDDLRSVLDALKIDRATLIGLSAGAEIAVDFALVHPGRVRRLVLASPGLGGYVPSDPMAWAQPVFAAAGAGDADRAARLWVATPLMTLRRNVTAAPVVADLITSNVKLWSYKTNPVQPLTPAAIKRLGEIKSPALVITGEQDMPYIKDVGRLLVEGIAGAKAVTIPGAGHIVNIDAPEPFNGAIDEFLNAAQPK